MKIATNVIGNYNPYQVRNVKAAANMQKTAPAKPAEKITSEEKDFFTKLYPDSKKEIVDYHFYQKSGQMNGVSVGTLFDKRG